MCGYVVALNNKNKKLNLQDLYKRGPDETNSFYDGDIFFHHSRLNLVGSSEGRQPYKIKNDLGTLVYNGEIFNFKDLNYKYNLVLNESDTKSLANAFGSLSKSNFLNYLRDIDGMFSFVFYSKDEGKIYFCRDQFGQKPLYYHLDKKEKKIIISSIINPIKQEFIEDPITLEIDDFAYSSYFYLGYIPSPMTIYKKIRSAIPGKFYEIDLKSFNLTWIEYKNKFSLNKEISKKNIISFQEEFWFLFKSSILRRTNGINESIPLALSGGIDSALVLKAFKELNIEFKAYFVDVGGSYSEKKYVKMLEDIYKIKAEFITLNRNNKEELNKTKLSKIYGQPFADTAHLNVFSLVKKISSTEHSKIILWGAAADELFLGYSKYNLLIQKKVDPKLVPFRNKSMKIGKYSQFEVFNWMKNEISIDKESEIGIKEINMLDIRFFLEGDVFPLIDRNAGYFAMEARSPFMSTQIVDFAKNLPLNFKISSSTGKIILKNILSEDLPDSFLYRQKSGFNSDVSLFTTKILPKIKDRSQENNLIPNTASNEEFYAYTVNCYEENFN